MCLKTPAFSLDYFPSTEVAWSLFQPDLYFPRSSHAQLATYGSFNSSNGPWASDGTEAEYQTQPLSNTPPALTRRASHASSPEIKLDTASERIHRRAASILSTSPIAYASRLLTLTAPSSPPEQFRKDPALSTSAPATGPHGSGITWGQNTIHIASAAPRHAYSRQSTGLDAEDSVDDDDYSIDNGQEVSVVLKNQTLFDDEGHVSVPLLCPTDAPKHKRYRDSYADILYMWELPFQRCEVMKFDALTAYFDSSLGSADQATMKLEKKAPQRSGSAGEVWQGIMPLVHCKTCGEIVALQQKSGLSLQRCAECQSTPGLLQCQVCGESVQGLYESCDMCGHAAHANCFDRWVALNDRGRFECKTGCTCLCYAKKDDMLSSNDAASEGTSGDALIQRLLPQDERTGFDWLVG